MAFVITNADGQGIVVVNATTGEAVWQTSHYSPKKGVWVSPAGIVLWEDGLFTRRSIFTHIP